MSNLSGTVSPHQAVANPPTTTEINRTATTSLPHGYQTENPASNLEDLTSNFLGMPPELRECVYQYVIDTVGPVDTSATPGYQQALEVPRIAQVNRLIRWEVLHYLYKNRPVVVSLHSEANVKRARSWAEKLGDHFTIQSAVTFTGRIAYAENYFFSLTLECLEQEPFFRVSAKPAMSQKATLVLEAVVEEVVRYVEFRISSWHTRHVGTLDRGELLHLITLISTEAQLPPIASSEQRQRFRAAQRQSRVVIEQRFY